MPQNKVIWFIQEISCRTPLSVDDYKELGFSNVDKRSRQKRHTHACKIFNNPCPDYFKEILLKQMKCIDKCLVKRTTFMYHRQMVFLIQMY